MDLLVRRRYVAQQADGAGRRRPATLPLQHPHPPLQRRPGLGVDLVGQGAAHIDRGVVAGEAAPETGDRRLLPYEARLGSRGLESQSAAEPVRRSEMQDSGIKRPHLGSELLGVPTQRSQ